MQANPHLTPCPQCPSRTPFKAHPDTIQRGRDLIFEPPLDVGIREIVETLIAHGVETFESCQGGEGHAFPEPTVRFEGDTSEGLRALSVALAYRLPVLAPPLARRGRSPTRSQTTLGIVTQRTNSG